jgi:hypothetical protein
VEARRIAGLELMAVATYRHIGFDHVVPPKWLVDITGCNALLTVNCLVSGEMENVPVLSVGAQDTAAALFLHWIKIRGLFRTTTTDNALAMQVLDIIIKLCGTRSHRLTDIADKEALGGTETRNNAAQEAITEMGATGDVTCRVDMDIYIAKAVMKRNMVIVSAGSTVFQRTHGVEPSTTASWMVAKPDMEAEIAALSGDNADFMLDIFDKFNIQVSIKNLPLAAPSTVVKATGSTLTEEGWGCDETLYEVLRAAGAKSVKGTQQAQTVIGVMQQAHVGVK